MAAGAGDGVCMVMWGGRYIDDVIEMFKTLKAAKAAYSNINPT